MRIVGRLWRKREGFPSRIHWAGIVSLAVYLLIYFGSPTVPAGGSETMNRASRIMAEALEVVRQRVDGGGMTWDAGADPNRTGLIGPEYSDLMTTVGELEAKRTTTNPNMAGLVVRLLREAGVRPGDKVAVASSGSFPALLIATLSAARAMRLRPVTILSLGASSYGATRPRFDLLDIYEALQEAGIFRSPPAAVSLGGAKDLGLDFEPEARSRLVRQIRLSGIPFLYETGGLRRNVAARIRIYREGGPGAIAAFINCGGSYSSLGTSPLILKVQPGVHREDLDLPSPEERGVLFEMAARKVPVVHLLYIKGLVLKYGLPWDPVPLPPPGAAAAAAAGAGNGVSFLVLACAYFVVLALLALWPARGDRRSPERSAGRLGLFW